MLRLGFMGNFFGTLPPMQSLSDCDIMILIGSICNPYVESPLETVKIEQQDKWINKEFNPWLESAQDYCPNIIIVPGIYDIACQFYDRNMEYHLKGTYLNNELTTVCGLKIYGSPYSPYIEKPKNLNFIHSDAKLKDLYSSINPLINILATYCPPYKILDEGRFLNKKFENLGSRSLKSILDSKIFTQLKVHAFSHAEKDCGKTIEHNGVRFVNVSPTQLITMDV